MLVLKSYRPLGQGVVAYTHQGEEALVPVSLGSSVICTSKQREMDRDSGILEAFGETYDRVTVAGSIEVRNLNQRDITIHIEKPIVGKVKKVFDEARTDERYTAGLLPNLSSTIHWRLSVPKEGTVTVTFQYQTLVSSRNKGFLSF